MKLCDRCGRCLLVREVLYHEIAKSLGLLSFSCYDEWVNDTLEPVIAQIKEGRLQGLDDAELEQQLLLGSWTEQEIQSGRNFLHLTHRSSSFKDPMTQDVLQKEEAFRHREVHKKFFLYWILPIGIIGGLSIEVGLLLNNFLYSRVTNTTSSHVVVTSATSTANTQASSTSASTSLSVLPRQDNDKASHFQFRFSGIAVCTRDKFVCPNGNTVGRAPPSCEFASCAE